MEELAEFWDRVGDETVHPDDRPVFDAWDAENIDADETVRRPFNLDYLPFTFFGAIETAPVLVLFGNSGFDAVETPKDFEGLADKYGSDLHALRTAITNDPEVLSSYYSKSKLRALIQKGKVGWINAVAYRSRKSDSAALHRLSKRLPSVIRAKAWLRQQIMPRLEIDNRLVIAHRWALWDLNRKVDASDRVRFSNNPASPHLSGQMMSLINSFLVDRQLPPPDFANDIDFGDAKLTELASALAERLGVSPEEAVLTALRNELSR